MSTLGEDDLARLAQLTRLQISAPEIPAATKAMNNILTMMGQLQNADVSGEDETAHVQFWGHSLRLRDDVALPGYASEALMSGAPQTHDGYFIVPKVIE